MSLQITISPKERVAGRFVSRVRRAIQKALAEEHVKNGTTQSDLARAIGINRSVVSREIRGHKDLTLSRVAELAWALGRHAVIELREPTLSGNQVPIIPQTGSGKLAGVLVQPVQSGGTLSATIIEGKAAA